LLHNTLRNSERVKKGTWRILNYSLWERAHLVTLLHFLYLIKRASLFINSDPLTPELLTVAVSTLIYLSSVLFSFVTSTPGISQEQTYSFLFNFTLFIRFNNYRLYLYIPRTTILLTTNLRMTNLRTTNRRTLIPEFPRMRSISKCDQLS
jgi:hypothetical protein